MKKQPLYSETKKIDISEDVSVYFDKDDDLWIEQENDTFVHQTVLKPEEYLKLVEIIKERIELELDGKIK